MPNFSVKYRFTEGGVVYHKTAIVRASSIEAAHNKLVDYVTCSGNKFFKDFKIISTSISSYNLIVS